MGGESTEQIQKIAVQDFKTSEGRYLKKLLAYVELLETENREMLTALKYCVDLLDRFWYAVPDPDRWPFGNFRIDKDRMEEIRQMLREGERIYKEEELH